MRKSIRNARREDLDRIWQLNESVVPHVNSITVAEFEAFLRDAAYFRVMVGDDDRMLGFLVALAPGSSYNSPNFGWFKRHYTGFAYIDRIAVTSEHRGQGVAKALYDDLAGFARDWAASLACEVNLRPPNPGSLAFHQKVGFTEVGRQEIYDGEKLVAMLMRPIAETD
jgi:predicted GNAT superfamily acetyltransferase